MKQILHGYDIAASKSWWDQRDRLNLMINLIW